MANGYPLDKQELIHSKQACTMFKMPTVNLFNTINPNFRNKIYRLFKADRTYELPDRTFYIVLSPRNKWEEDNYSDDIKRIEKQLRNKYKYKRILITREINAKKTHYNVLLTCLEDLNKNHNKTFSRYYHMYVQECPFIKDIYEIINYCTKEASERSMNKNDYHVFCK